MTSRAHAACGLALLLSSGCAAAGVDDETAEVMESPAETEAATGTRRVDPHEPAEREWTVASRRTSVPAPLPPDSRAVPPIKPK
jgi:hypothetical protein